MRLILESAKSSWLYERDGLYTLDLESTRAGSWSYNLIENIKVFKTDDGSYVIKADEIEFKYYGDDFSGAIINEKQKELLEIPQKNVYETPEIKGFPFFKKPTGKVLTLANGYCRLKERKPFCLRVDSLTIKGNKQFCEEMGAR